MKEYKDGMQKEYANDLKYWSNCCGDLHHFGEYDIAAEELPPELQEAYNTLWSENTGSLCYLVSYKGKNYVALINEYNDCYARDINTTMGSLYIMAKEVASKIENESCFDNTKVLLSESMGCEECHELVVLVNPNETKDKFSKIAEWLYENAYIK